MCFLEQRIDIGKPSVGIAVGIVDGSGRRVVGYGSLDGTTNSSKPNGETVFEIGSVSKVFTGLLQAYMVRRGEVELSDPITKFLPESLKVLTG